MTTWDKAGFLATCAIGITIADYIYFVLLGNPLGSPEWWEKGLFFLIMAALFTAVAKIEDWINKPTETTK